MVRITKQNITIHIGNIYEEGELTEIQLVKIFYKFKKKETELLKEPRSFTILM
jgi:hypothetical protein